MDGQEAVMVVADAIQRAGLADDEPGLLSAFVAVAVIEGEDGPYLVTYSATGTGGELPQWTKIGLLRTTLARYEAEWARASMGGDDG